ncbi:MAG TPA: universal stress protein [Streptosporangiaceae bacterium]
MSETSKIRRIVVGVTGSAASIEALRWAAEEARMSGGELTVVHAWLPPDRLYPAPYAPARVRGSPKEAQRLAEAELAAAMRQVFVQAPAIKVREILECGSPARVLLAAAGGANLLVLGGHRSKSPLTHTVGPVAAACLRRSPCPVVVVSPSMRAEPAAHMA